MPRVIHFEIPADSPERAAKFYQEVFGWRFQKWEGPMEYWMVTTGAEGKPGINGGLLRRQHPGQGTVNTVDVESVDAAVATVEKNGGKIALPKMAIPGVGYLAYGIDPEGNIFGMMQADSSAH
jgi:predicted enzyme related to lactoylglutathione lyase